MGRPAVRQPLRSSWDGGRDDGRSRPADAVRGRQEVGTGRLPAVVLPRLARPAPILSRLRDQRAADARSEEHTSELQSLMRISYAVFCLTKKTKNYIPQ